ncbi:hypothetical protein [Aureimonas phyllosphaerae]|uniref:Uncharacterized protein n=1 Tax=Aureimonas phyllosphaerae TaxID=1166078 RepID=A0A7W6FVN9_9HYPH|nr:hypothetical protein [Aureimonas phyllosphaerae]MBB3937351.1 hypothetical protein [Aureimonas phyllosphaerae]MBB3961358.1 hypothetical protein [Aureimonas phyllosphaerae]
MKLKAEKAVGRRVLKADKLPSKVSVEDVALAFGAVQGRAVGDDDSPFSLWQVAKEMERRLVSTGGRPSLPGASAQLKVNLLDEDVEILSSISDSIGVEKYKPSKSQIITILVHMALSQFSKDDIRRSFASTIK